MSNEREMEMSEYLLKLKPEHVHALVIENAQLKHERDAFKTTIAAVVHDNKIATKQVDKIQTQATKLLNENRDYRKRLGLPESG